MSCYGIEKIEDCKIDLKIEFWKNLKENFKLNTIRVSGLLEISISSTEGKVLFHKKI
jgi:hypothetical protein